MAAIITFFLAYAGYDQSFGLSLVWALIVLCIEGEVAR